MKRFKGIFIFMLITFMAFAKENLNENYYAQEVYMRIYPAYQYLEINEYNLKSTEKNSNSIRNNIKEQIKNNELAKNRYDFTTFASVSEKITNERGFVEAHFRLLSYSRNYEEMVADAFSKVLNTPVKVLVTEDKFIIEFLDEGAQFSNFNTEDAYVVEDMIRIEWDNNNEYLELLFSFDPSSNIYNIENFGNTVISPEMTDEEIDYLRNRSKPLEKDEFEYQSDADIYRFKHLKYYAGLIEEYKEKVGVYPFEGKENIPNYVFILNDKQKEGFTNNNPYKHKETSFKDFILELEKGLNREIKEYYDPQLVAYMKPNFYMYMIDGNEYYFAIHISDYYSFSNKIGDNYYKVEVSNVESKGLIKYKDLISNKDFIAKLNSKVNKEAWFIELEEKYINHTKN